tara:strand:+ start:647 stop:847 length:201 start_codon:yes stop_codon:yes gene_type:complete
MKKKNSYTKHDIRRGIKNLEDSILWMSQRIRTFETVFNDYIEMQENEDKFKDFLDGKYKQPEHKQS